MTLNLPSLPVPVRTNADAGRIADWLRSAGFGDADTVSGSWVEGSGLLAAISASSAAVGRGALLDLHRAAGAQRVEAYFAVGGYTAVAQEWADHAHVALFRLDVTGEPVALNATARGLAPARDLAPAPELACAVAA